MAANTSRSTPRKAAPRKAPARPTTIEEKADVFEAYRARAAGLSLGEQSVTPFILGREWGFDPPLEVPFPAAASDRFTLDITFRNRDHRPFLLSALSVQQLARVFAAVNAEPDADKLLHVLMLKMGEHFFGQGIADVPGGTQAS
ncbi:hypothetical protein [Nocardia sp. NPDC050793]|uniref:hypothetical protein n=1 Tax=Nocardia sp. NPDC050793 TaxID=3155159 RepID=UPI0033D0A5DF